MEKLKVIMVVPYYFTDGTTGVRFAAKKGDPEWRTWAVRIDELNELEKQALIEFEQL